MLGLLIHSAYGTRPVGTSCLASGSGDWHRAAQSPSHGTQRFGDLEVQRQGVKALVDAGGLHHFIPRPWLSLSCTSLTLPQEFVEQEFGSVYPSGQVACVNMVHDQAALEPLVEEYNQVSVGWKQALEDCDGFRLTLPPPTSIPLIPPTTTNCHQPTTDTAAQADPGGLHRRGAAPAEQGQAASPQEGVFVGGTGKDFRSKQTL